MKHMLSAEKSQKSSQTRNELIHNQMATSNLGGTSFHTLQKQLNESPTTTSSMLMNRTGMPGRRRHETIYEPAKQGHEFSASSISKAAGSYKSPRVTNQRLDEDINLQKINGAFRGGGKSFKKIQPIEQVMR